jgi:hypothetical protein
MDDEMHTHTHISSIIHRVHHLTFLHLPLLIATLEGPDTADSAA